MSFLFWLGLLVLTALLAFILSQVPVRVSVAYRYDSGSQDFHLRVNLGALTVYRMAVPAVRLKWDGPSPVVQMSPGKREGEEEGEWKDIASLQNLYRLLREFLPRYARLSRYLSRRARWTECRLRLELGTADAARTGLLVGYTWAGVGFLLPFISRYADLSRIRPRIEVIPFFRREQFSLLFNSVFELKIAFLVITAYHYYRLHNLTHMGPNIKA